jgi:hypothetical protein
MMEDKEFLDDVINAHIVQVVDEAERMMKCRRTLPDIYNYILRNSRNQDGYITMFLFGVRHQKFKEGGKE